MSSSIDPAKQRQLAAMEQKINEMVQQSRVLEAYLNDVVTRQITVNRLLEEARLASSTIQNVSSDSELESLMPIGIGVYVKTTIPPITKLLVNFGAGIAIEKNKDDALNYIEERIKEYEIATRQLEGQRQEIAMRMEQVQGQINQMLKAAQAQTPQYQQG